MIYTVTLNPSLDHVLRVPRFAVGAINRAEEETIYPGGKGLNVSIMLGRLGIPSTALGFAAGFSGAEIMRLLELEGCACDFIDTGFGCSRINTKICGEAETAVNGRGPRISEKNAEELFAKLDALEEGDVLVLAGSVPAGLPDDIYARMFERVGGKGVRVAVDAEGALLLGTLRHGPFLVKPNHEEIGAMFGLPPLETVEEIVAHAARLREMGARNVLVSRGKDGAVLLDADGKTHVSRCPDGTAVNTVGAGDSMVAGFIAGFLRSGDYGEALRCGVCAGSATAFSEWLADRRTFDALYGAFKA